MFLTAEYAVEYRKWLNNIVSIFSGLLFAIINLGSLPVFILAEAILIFFPVFVLIDIYHLSEGWLNII
jgi:hypothetical protein